MDIYDKFVSVGEIYCDGCAALFVITMYVRLLTWSKHNLTRLDCWPPSPVKSWTIISVRPTFAS